MRKALLPTAAALWVTALGAVFMGAQSTSRENMVRDRGQTRTSDPTQTVDRGRIGSQGAVPPKPVLLTGILVDAGCRDRSALNLKRAPQPAATVGTYAPSAGAGGVSAQGITVDQKTLDAERDDAMAQHVPELFTRQSDRACAITGATRGYALLMDNGRFLDLDEGGNTYATQAVQSSEAGSRMLNGAGPGIKPRVKVMARIVGDKAVTQSLEIE